jgi:hypothetical protein
MKEGNYRGITKRKRGIFICNLPVGGVKIPND